VVPYVSDINPRIGILSTPVIDASAEVIYVVAETFEEGAPVFRLHALSLVNGQEMQNGTVPIAASSTGTGSDA